LALDGGTRTIWLECVAPSDVAQQRLLARHGDASDADWAVFQLVRDRWEPSSNFSSQFFQVIEAEGPSQAAGRPASDTLRANSLQE